ncbi:uncharacterized protein K452DRAFT_234621 [Aplosporella prunicola CBS 121167]|uniref:SET domain-containing protein n=1 Tax=Aplosporella prunicola CBS 121167 TaxID=1176127 RepID=A0A6A6B6A1_9PEZI|nr:uncharacterized protein K452DRAFT_234621 [Aplosporella prunicola CBS 121167]KAF2138311.1 hypothetical protein K452DRAFT_234621 [Aplosporella prunicola CBS 121167]
MEAPPAPKEAAEAAGGAAAPFGAPTSSLYAVRDTAFAGRGVFATQDIAAGTPLWCSEAPSAHVIFRQYRKEVCGQCFAYDGGNMLKTRDNVVGFVFCSPECREEWRREQGEVGVVAWTEVQKLCKGCPQEPEMVDAYTIAPDPTDIATAWADASTTAATISTARSSPHSVSKAQLKALRNARAHIAAPDTLAFLLSGLLAHYQRPEAWPATLALWPNPTPYRSAAELDEHTSTFLQLRAVLPPVLAVSFTADVCAALASRDSRNSFGIRSLDDGGAEFFGYGTWPSASYFNHSCDPNVEKRREGRKWLFRCARDVKVGDELCITYLSGEERAMAVQGRMELLEKSWGFECACVRCRAGE